MEGLLVTSAQSGDGSAQCHLTAGCCCLAAWLAMVTKLVPDNLHPSYQLMGSAVTIQIISGQKQCIYIFYIQCRRKIYCLYVQTE